ncbi:hypothetical protein GCM10025867_46010 (plasmid) [Frondihabitans sucicola]|uniref:Uncharacterized protein n=1 Tax=Frondihabitans sucicola TaxID=1268041 RepID=A0ABM8GV63_9MICO|nr:hypothetical protein [Frondihabitans sucicola]BDZ52360.1 hypothetical protein GCM10025867_46010 [Frondihabitans sucicola]
MSATTLTKTAAEYRADAARQDADAIESFERSDTDGFASQAASGIMASLNRLKAEIVEQGGTWEFPALFDLDGNLVDAKNVRGQYGPVWCIRDNNGDATGWFSESSAQNADRRRATNAKKGYYVGRVRAEAYAVNTGGGSGFAGMFGVHPIVLQSKDGAITIVDNGQ